MKVISYVEGTLTVINGDNYYNEIAAKPSFIAGTNFYCEPTLQQMDGIALTDTQIADAEAFITNFKFPTAPAIKKPVYCVDADGNYINYMVNDGTYKEATSAPLKDTEKWNGTMWVDSILIDKTTKKCLGVGDTRTLPNTEYAPNTVPTDFDSSFYTWDGTSWDISLADAKTCRSAKIKTAQTDAINAMIGEVATLEPVSFTTQEKEARAWVLDNTVATPFIDALLVSRNIQGETKKILADKIIKKADAYATAYATLLGKFQNLINKIQACTTVADVAKVVW